MDFGSLWHKWTPKGPLLSHMILNGITQPLIGKVAITQPFLDQFWIVLVQMNTKGSCFVQCGSQLNRATFQWENSHNSAISWQILDCFGTNEHQRVPFCPMWLSMEHPTSQGGNGHNSAIFRWLLDLFVQINTKASPSVPCGSQRNHATSQWENGCNSAISWLTMGLFGTIEHQRIPFCPMWFSI